MKPYAVVQFASVLACVGVFFVSAASAATETVIYAFKGGDDGEGPTADLIYIHGMLYGTTFYGGGTPDDGTVFSVTPDGSEMVQYSFCSHRNCSDGAEPEGSLINVNGKLYGATLSGGSGRCESGGCGTVFSITRSGEERMLHAFEGGAGDGSFPEAGLTNVNGTLYGTTSSGGAHADGTVFSITPGGTETVLYSFCSRNNCTDGSLPSDALIDVKGTLYGTTYYGGGLCGDNCGTVFSMTPSGTETVLYAFKGGSDGANPTGVIDVNGTLYGTTGDGGDGSACFGGCGTVFSITPSGKETVLYAFQGGNDGIDPQGGLISVKGTLYGTTWSGGALDGGTVFSIKP